MPPSGEVNSPLQVQTDPLPKCVIRGMARGRLERRGLPSLWEAPARRALLPDGGLPAGPREQAPALHYAGGLTCLPGAFPLGIREHSLGQVQSFVFNHLLGSRIRQLELILLISNGISVNGPLRTLVVGNPGAFAGAGAILCFQPLVGILRVSGWVISYSFRSRYPLMKARLGAVLGFARRWRFLM